MQVWGIERIGNVLRAGFIGIGTVANRVRVVSDVDDVCGGDGSGIGVSAGDVGSIGGPGTRSGVL